MSSDRWYGIGHYTDANALTGCTVLLFDRQVPAAVDVRGGAPGTRETNLMGFGQRGLVDAVVLSGGSSFGLATVDGVSQFLVERGRGYETPAGPVPLIPGAIIFDLMRGEQAIPGPKEGYAAAEAAHASSSLANGQIGAGTGATVAKLGGSYIPSGLGIGSANVLDIDVQAVVVLNAVGDVVDPVDRAYLAKTIDPLERGRTGRDLALERNLHPRSGENTTIGCILISNPLSRYGLERCCISAHDALARCVVPAHTIADGDTFFAASRSAGSKNDANLFGICCAVEVAVERAIVGIFKD